jgi:hypothetical protein
MEWNKLEIWTAIHKLTDMREKYDACSEEERPNYNALTVGIDALKEIMKQITEDECFFDN